MSKTRFEWKVGLFVFIGLVLLAGLLLEFTKGMTFFRSTYDIYLRAINVGGLKVQAGVLMSGVQVGTVSDFRLSPSGTNVTITLRIFGEYKIFKDARFVIEQSGFLGDQYVAIEPTENKGDTFKNGDIAYAEAPFNLQEFTRTASGFIGRIDETVKKLNDALAEVTRVLLTPETLTNLAISASNLRQVSQRALSTVDNINSVVNSNTLAISGAVSNLSTFSGQLNDFAGELRGLVATNSGDITLAVKNIESSTEILKSVMSDLQAGKGVAGNLLRNQELTAKVSQIADNLSITSSNLNRLGLWGVMWQHQPPKTNRPPERPLTAPKNPYD
jgi:ABC-type transporter Mla subunit MlaD